MVVTLVATMIFSLSADYKHNQHNKLDWRGATIEGFRPGATLLQIESLRGPATVSKEGYWFWKSPDLILTDRGSNLSLTGHQLECQGRIFHCGNRFATDQAFDNLKLGTRKKTHAPEPASQADILNAFGAGTSLGEELDYRDRQGLLLTFVFYPTEKLPIIKSTRRISSVTFTYKGSPHETEKIVR